MKTQEAIDHFGGVKKLADALGVWPQAIYKYGKVIPENVAYKLEVITEGKLKVMGSDYVHINSEKDSKGA